MIASLPASPLCLPAAAYLSEVSERRFVACQQTTFAGRSSRVDLEHDDRASSTMSVGGRSSATEDVEWSDDEGDAFAAALDDLLEKRSATREAALSKLVQLLTSEWQFEECTFKQDTLTRLFITSFRRGGAAEATLAARALGLHVLTLGAGEAAEQIFSEASSLFQPVIDAGRMPCVRAAAIEAYTIMCFVACDSHDTSEVMQELMKAYLSAGKLPEVQAAALRGWALLFTTLPAHTLGTEFIEKHLKILSALLHSEDVDVRTAAGEAVALIWSECDLSQLPASSPTTKETTGDEVAVAERLEDILSRMRDLAVNRGDESRRSKKDRASLRSTFRELISIMEDDEPPEQKLKLQHGDVLCVDTLSGNIQLNFLRSFLAEGFQAHLQSNELLHQVFNYIPRSEKPEKLTRLEKRMYRSPGSAMSKERSQNRRLQRQKVAAYKEGY